MKPKKWELILVVMLVLGLALWAFLPRKAGNTVTVTVDGDQVGTYSLARDIEQPISGYGDFNLLLVISRGQAFVKESSCPDLICQKHAPIFRSGEQIICLPARVVITVTGEEAEIDAVTG